MFCAGPKINCINPKDYYYMTSNLQRIRLLLKPFILICIITLASCTHKLAGTTYAGSDQYKSLSIKFANDSLCEIHQKILCKNIDTQYQPKTILAVYKKIRFTVEYYKSQGPVMTGHKKRKSFNGISVSNINCKDCEGYNYIPNFLPSGCTEEKDSIIIKISGLGRIDNFLHDTLILDKGILYFGTVKAIPINSK
jgi:hypothetical protein